MNQREPLTVERLLESPALQMRLIAGRSGLGRRVSWAHVSELDDPRPWLSGGELIMTTGLGFPRAATKQRDYLRRLDDGGVAGLGVSAQLHMPPMSRMLLNEADARGFPILEVPLSVPFIAVAQEVAAAVQDASTQRLNAQLQVFGAVRWLTTEDLDEAEVFARLERLSGFQIYLCTPRFLPLFPGVPVPPADVHDILSRSVESAPTIPGGFALPIPVLGSLGGFLLALERPGKNHAGLAVVQHIATVAALQLTMRKAAEETQRREGAETLAEMIQGTLPAGATRRRLSRFGFDPAAHLQLLAVRGQGEAPQASAISRALASSDIAHLLLQQRDQAFVLTGNEADLELALADIAGIGVGVSASFEQGESLHLPRREALWAVARAADSGAKVVRFGEDSIGRWVVEDAAALNALVAAVLGPVLDYDREHGIDLLRTVQTWMERDRQNAIAAEVLHLHTNTLSYRLKRFEELTGRDLRSTADLAEIWLALRAMGDLTPDKSR